MQTTVGPITTKIITNVNANIILNKKVKTDLDEQDIVLALRVENVPTLDDQILIILPLINTAQRHDNTPDLLTQLNSHLIQIVIRTDKERIETHVVEPTQHRKPNKPPIGPSIDDGAIVKHHAHKQLRVRAHRNKIGHKHDLIATLQLILHNENIAIADVEIDGELRDHKAHDTNDNLEQIHSQ